jgi:hypothetical protein
MVNMGSGSSVGIRACSTSTPSNVADESWLWRNGSMVNIGSKTKSATRDGVAQCLATSASKAAPEVLVVAPCGKGPNELKLRLVSKSFA